ncbi:MAG: BrnT family toxin [Holophagaceae bacterium]|nr:BrnT family toxin [Holophagaceae bacterium]
MLESPMIRFEWDEKNATEHERKHGINFEDAKLAILDPNSITEPDTRFDYTEERYRTLGMVANSLLMLLVAHTIEENGDEVIRIISARKAEPHERRRYDNHNF